MEVPQAELDQPLEMPQPQLDQLGFTHHWAVAPRHQVRFRHHAIRLTQAQIDRSLVLRRSVIRVLTKHFLLEVRLAVETDGERDNFEPMLGELVSAAFGKQPTWFRKCVPITTRGPTGGIVFAVLDYGTQYHRWSDRDGELVYHNSNQDGTVDGYAVTPGFEWVAEREYEQIQWGMDENWGGEPLDISRTIVPGTLVHLARGFCLVIEIDRSTGTVIIEIPTALHNRTLRWIDGFGRRHTRSVEPVVTGELGPRLQHF